MQERADKLAVPFEVRLSERQIKLLDEEAAARGLKRSDVLRAVLDAALDPRKRAPGSRFGAYMTWRDQQDMARALGVFLAIITVGVGLLGILARTL